MEERKIKKNKKGLNRKLQPSVPRLFPKILSQSERFKEGDLRVNKDGDRIVQQYEDEAAPPKKPSDNHQSLADFGMIKVIGKGSSGIVLLVRHKRTGQFFALKAIQANFRETLVKQIAREVIINRSAQYTNVATCYQSFYKNGIISIIFEYMDGGSLSDFLKKVVAIPEPYLAAICKQVLKGFSYLHHHKHIIHRDMKPSNLLINHRGEVKITGFGASAILATASTERNTFVGTYNYMSPERITGESYGYKSDIWSLGLVILECATGQFPYSTSEQEEGWYTCYDLMEAIVDGELPHAPPEQFSPEFCSFISACLQKDPNDRLAANELMEHSFIKKYEDKDVNLASYFADAGSPLATFGTPICRNQDIAAPETEKFLHIRNLENVEGRIEDAEIAKLEETEKFDNYSRNQDIVAPETEKFLHIRNLENVEGGIEDAEIAKLKDKQHLEDLYLSWNSSSDDDDDDDECIGRSANDGKVLDALQPRPNLKILTISGFKGLKFPKWMGSSSNFLPNLVELYISYCTRCEKLPALGMLPCLRVLWIYGMRSMKCLGQEFYYQEEEEITPSFAKATTVTLFPSLIELSIENMKTLEEWVAPPPPYICFPILETLWIIGCSELASVPDFQLYTSLRELTIRDCYKLSKESTSFDLIEKEEHDSSEVYQSPNSITIDRYLVQQITSGTPEHCGILDIEALKTEKFLHIKNLENVRGGIEDAERAKLKDKQHLEDLYLSWNSSSNDDHDECTDRSVNDGMVLEGLQPHPNLRKLSISGFEGLQLPKWMMGSSSNSLPNLVELYLLECNSCEQLPVLGMLPCLKILQIKGMNSVKCLPAEFYYQQQESGDNSNTREIKEEINAKMASGISLFPSLIELSLIDMSILEEWAAPPLFFNSFPSLESLIVSGCLRLKSISLPSCSSLKSLELCNTNDEMINSILASGVERLTSLVSVSIQDSPQFEFFPVILQKDARIQSLKFEYCSKFQGFRILDADNDNKEFQAKLSSDTGFNTSISSLCSLKLTDCPALTSLPDLRKWTSLTELWIENCDKLKRSFSYDLKSLDNLKTLYVDHSIDLSQM